MSLRRGKNVNTNDTAVMSSAISLNNSTDTKILDANIAFIELIISNNSNRRVWVKPQVQGTDTDKKGILIAPNSSHRLNTDNVYTGEWCAIAETGSADVYITYW